MVSSSWIMLALLMQSLLARSAEPPTGELLDVFVDGQGPKAPNFLTADQVHQIKEVLGIEFDVPALNLGAAMPSPWNTTCGSSTPLTCGAMKFSITPGMEVTTAMVRNVAVTNSSTTTKQLAPTYSWTAKAGKYYSFFMADAMSNASFWAGMPPTQFHHFTVLNLQAANMTRGKWKPTMYAAPGNPVPDVPSHYASMIFEHDTPATGSAKGPNPYNLQAHLAAAGLSGAKLVAFNYWKAYGNAYSSAWMQSMNMPATMSACQNGMLKQQTCFSVKSKAAPTCLDIKRAYQEQKCCEAGNTGKVFTVPEKAMDTMV